MIGVAEPAFQSILCRVTGAPRRSPITRVVGLETTENAFVGVKTLKVWCLCLSKHFEAPSALSLSKSCVLNQGTAVARGTRPLCRQPNTKHAHFLDNV